MNLRNLVYIMTCLSFSVIIGAAVYEHIAVWPSAFCELPRSLTLFQGAYKLNSAPFWQSVHPVTLILFIGTLIASWKSERRKYVLVPLVAYILILVATFSFFVPELLSLMATPYSDTIDEGLTHRANTWVNLSLARMVILFAAAVLLYMGLTIPVARIKK
jgi:hypothetical protein